MRKLFRKYFLSIFAITVVSLIVQNGLLLLKYSQSQTQWKQVVYEDFVDRLQNNLENSTFPDFSLDTIELFSSALEDSRVSGFLVRDPDGKIAFTVGQTTDGEILASLAPRNMMIADRGTQITSEAYNTVLNIRYNRGSIEIERDTVSDKNKNYLIPSGINANDVIGTVTVMFESQSLSSIDILSYSPRTYKYSKDIINNCIHSLMVAVPICLVIALICAWIISSLNTKYIDSIRKALNDLSNGKSNVKLKPNKNSSLNEITTAVNELDKNLQANERSRHAWITSISHDLNTPATAMKMIVDGMNDGVFKPNKTNLRELQNENNTLCERINKVIDFSSLQAETKINADFVVCSDFADQILTEFGEIKTSVETEKIKCDRILMAKAVKELLKNAFANGKNVMLSIKKIGKQFCIEVQNEGSLPEGISTTNLFEPWTKGDSSRSTQGNGLGLPIVGTIAKLHKGSASISEKDGIVTASILWTL